MGEGKAAGEKAHRKCPLRACPGGAKDWPLKNAPSRSALAFFPVAAGPAGGARTKREMMWAMAVLVANPSLRRDKPGGGGTAFTF